MHSGTSLLNDFGLKDFVLSEFGTIQIADTAGAIAALLISAASIVGGDPNSLSKIWYVAFLVAFEEICKKKRQLCVPGPQYVCLA